MTILDVGQKVALRVIGNKPISMFTPSRDKQSVAEILDLMGDVAIDIAKSHDWQALTAIHTITGDGTTTAFPLPDDYGRMLLASGLIDPASWFWGYVHIPSVMDWMRDEAAGWNITPGAWIIIGNEFNFVPAPANTAEAKFPYITKNIFLSGSAEPRETITGDGTTFRLDERLLTLGTIWRWKEQKGLEYAEDMQTYEIALSQAQARDAGGRVIRSHSRTRTLNTRFAYPWSLGGV